MPFNFKGTVEGVIMSVEKVVNKRAYQKSWIKNRRDQWIAENGPCKCGSDDRLQVDHIDPKTKTTHRIWSWSEERRKSELLKCQVLCYSCHKKKSAKECSDRFSGVPRLKLRTIKNSDLKKALDLVSSGMSERKACEIVGISRGTFSYYKLSGSRKEVFGG